MIFAYPEKGKSQKKKNKKNKTWEIKIILCHGEQGWYWEVIMPLCFMEGPEGGTGKAFGRKPLTKLGELLLLLNLRGFSLKISCLNLEPWLKPT